MLSADSNQCLKHLLRKIGHQLPLNAIFCLSISYQSDCTFIRRGQLCLWMFWGGNTCLASRFFGDKFRHVTPLLLLFSCNPSFPIIWLKVFSLLNCALHSLARIFRRCLRKWSHMCSNHSQKLSFETRTMYDILSPTDSTVQNTDLIFWLKKILTLIDDFNFFDRGKYNLLLVHGLHCRIGPLVLPLNATYTLLLFLKMSSVTWPAETIFYCVGIFSRSVQVWEHVCTVVTCWFL